jgi:hypothetical protein
MGLCVANIMSWYYICKYPKIKIKNMEQEKITWSPETKIEITGREFEFLARLVSLFEVPYAQLSPKDLQETFVPAIQTTQDILKRMIEGGVANKGEDLPSVSEVATEEPIL